MKKPESAVRLGPVALQILRYLSGRRDAQDTVEGIAEWWSLEQRIRVALADVENALAELTKEGLVVGQSCQGRRRCYRLDSRQSEAITLLLQRKRPVRRARAVGGQRQDL